jgi:hypothetical protein
MGMRKRGKLPFPPRIDAIAWLDDLEDLAEAFFLTVNAELAKRTPRFVSQAG